MYQDIVLTSIAEKKLKCPMVGLTNCIAVTYYILYHLGSPLGPEGWDVLCWRMPVRPAHTAPHTYRASHCHTSHKKTRNYCYTTTMWLWMVCHMADTGLLSIDRHTCTASVCTHNKDRWNLSDVERKVWPHTITTQELVILFTKASNCCAQKVFYLSYMYYFDERKWMLLLLFQYYYTCFPSTCI